MYSIEIIKSENIEIIIPLLQKLNSSISEEVLRERIDEMLSNNYECVGVFEGDKLIGISGIWILTKYYVGKHVEPDNVYILEEYQGKGIGELMMNWIFDYAKSKGCVASELNCYVGNKNAHRFWENQGYKKIAYHFQREL